MLALKGGRGKTGVDGSIPQHERTQGADQSAARGNFSLASH